jgi:hypothetical protein
LPRLVTKEPLIQAILSGAAAMSPERSSTPC